MGKQRSLAVIAALVLWAATLPAQQASGSSDALASPRGLPVVSSGTRPGPAVLYAPPPAAPQLENRDPRFVAQPLLVSGADAYKNGEYLYQDHLNDDFGADTDGTTTSPFSAFAGDIVYPTDRARYAGNAADLVEFRIAPGASSVAYRVTLNALVVADSTVVAIAFDTDNNAATGRPTLPRDPGAAFPGTDEVITAWGTGAEHSALPTVGAAVTSPVEISTDLEANQITITVPRSLSNPHTAWKTTVAVGLLDKATGGWLRPASAATATAPGGASPTVPAPSGIFNLAFRSNENYLSSNNPPDVQQATALRAGTPTLYTRSIDFAALDARTSRSTVPASGTQVRIFASHLKLGEGRNFNAFPAFLGQLQPYSLYVPTGLLTPAPLTLALHSLSQFHWQYNGSIGIQQIGEQRRNLVATSLSRGENGWYQRAAEYDVFEMWADIARNFSLDPARAYVSGYSMGGYATYRLATLYPDLFAAAYSVVGPPGEGIWVPPTAPSGGAHTLTNTWLPNARHVPFLNLAAVEDELVPIVGPRAQNLGAPELGIKGFDTLGYRFRYLQLPAAEHYTVAVTGYDDAAARDFLGNAQVDRDPAHVTFVYTPAADDAALGLVHDHAYWVADLRLAKPAGGQASIDAFSHASGLGDPPSTAGQTAGTLSSGLPFVEFNRTWGSAPRITAENKLTLRLENVSSVALAADRAGIDASKPLTIVLTSTDPAVLTIERSGEPATLDVAAGTHTYVLPALVLARGQEATLAATGYGQRSWPILAAVILAIALAGRRLRCFARDPGRG